MTTNISNPLNSLERTNLRNCEKTIERGCQTFVDVGRALVQVRTENLYRETHQTFRAYCEKRWGFTDRRARQFMEGATVVENVTSGTIVPPSRECQTRPLSQLPEEQQATAWSDAVEEADGGQPTAAQVQEAVDAYIEPEEDKESEEDAPLPDEPPKEVDRAAYYDQWTEAIKPVVQLVETIAADLGEQHCPCHETVQGQLDVCTEEMDEWLNRINSPEA